MSRGYSNNFSTTLNGAITDVATSIVVASVAGLPTVGSGATCRLTIDNNSDAPEIVEVTAAAGTTLTVIRGVEGTTAIAWADGDTVELRATAASFIDPDGDIDFSAADSLKVPTDAAPTLDADGKIAIDTTVTDFSAGVMKYYAGEEMAVVSVPIAELTSPTDGHVVTYNATTDEFELAATGTPTLAVEDLSNVTESNTFAVGDTISLDDHTYLKSGNPYITGGGIDLPCNNYQYRKYGWQNVSGTVYPQIVGADATQYIGFDANGPKLYGSGTSYIKAKSTNIEVKGDILPQLDSSYDLGSASLAFAQVFTDSITFDGGTNSLNYYEEGTFTPTFDFATTGDLSNSYTAQIGVYTRIGNLVFFSSTIQWTPTYSTSSGNAKFGGIPFTIGSNVGFIVPQKSSNITFNGADTQLFGYSLGTIIELRTYASGTTSTSLTTANFTSGAAHTVVIAGVYRL